MHLAALLALVLASGPVPQADPRGALGECELASATLQGAVQTAIRGGQDIRVVAHLGDGERSPQINDFRLTSVRQYLEENVLPIGSKLLPGQLTVMHGDPVRGLGTVKVFVGGELWAEGFFKLRRDVCVYCCTPDGYGRGKNGFGRLIPIRRRPAPN